MLVLACLRLHRDFIGLVGYSLMGAGSAMKNGFDVALLYNDLSSQVDLRNLRKFMVL